MTDTYNMKVFTDEGYYFGTVNEAIVTQTKVSGWKVRADQNSFLSRVIGTAQGVIVPHELVKAMGDVMIISKAAVPDNEMDR